MLLDKIQYSPTLEVVYMVVEKKMRGEKVISLAVGEPSFDTPEDVKRRAWESMEGGETHYVPALGIPEVREAISRKVRRRNGIRAGVENSAFITNKTAIYAALLAIARRGFEVLIPDPGYFYTESVLLAGGRPVRYRLGDGFSLDVDEIRRVATPRTRAIVINTPSNPTGRVFSKDELRELYEFSRERGIYLISDEAYEDITFGKDHVSVGSLEEAPELVISIYSLSKSYSMTGWRAGYLVAHADLVKRISKFIEHTISCYPPFIQRAAAYALDEGERFIAEFREEYRRRREILLDEMRTVDGLEPNEIEGTFYAFPRVRADVGSAELSRRLLEEKNVAVLPGVNFGPSGEGHMRISFSVPVEELREGMAGLRDYMMAHRISR